MSKVCTFATWESATRRMMVIARQPTAPFWRRTSIAVSWGIKCWRLAARMEGLSASLGLKWLTCRYLCTWRTSGCVRFGCPLVCVCPRCCLISSFQKLNVSEALNEGSHVVDLRSVENWQPRNKGQYNSKLVCKTEIPRSLACDLSISWS